MDTYDDLSDAQIARCREASLLAMAIMRTDRKLASPAAQDPALRQTWTAKRQRQESQLRRLW